MTGRTIATLILVAAIVASSCGGEGTHLLDPCTTALGVAIDRVSIDRTGGSTNLHLDLTLVDEASSDVRVGGFIVECRYLDPDASALRGTCTVEMTVPAGDSLVVTGEPCPPGTVSWAGDPTGDDLRCTVEVVYNYTDLPCTPPVSRASTTGSQTIDVQT